MAPAGVEDDELGDVVVDELEAGVEAVIMTVLVVGVAVTAFAGTDTLSD